MQGSGSEVDAFEDGRRIEIGEIDLGHRGDSANTTAICDWRESFSRAIQAWVSLMLA